MKNVLITGTSRGIGEQLALKFTENGFHVIAVSRKKSTLLNAENIHQLSIDLSNTDDISKLKKELESYENIDIVINNAGKLIHKPFLEIETQDFIDIYQTNVFAVASLLKIAIPKMKKGAHVVNISSMGGVQGSVKFAGLSAYSSSKGALITLTELLAEEYKETGISFNVLALGAVQTEMLEEAFPDYQAPTTAKEMANFIYDFAVNSGKLINGKIIQVSSSTP
jgi:3-oxoacyl-[acyl-carrier protein] reductase